MKPLQAISDQQADDSLKSLADLDLYPVEFTSWSAVPCVAKEDRRDEEDHKDSDTEQVQLTDSELRLLTAIVNHPMLSSSQYVKLAKVSPNTLRKLRPVLMEKGLIKEHIMDSTGRGRSKRIWEPLETAKKIVAHHFELEI